MWSSDGGVMINLQIRLNEYVAVGLLTTQILWL